MSKRGKKVRGVLNPESELVAELVERIPAGSEVVFYCKGRRKKLRLDKCLEDWLNANAFNIIRSPCRRCPQGRKNREDFSRF